MILRSYVKPLNWSRPPADVSALDQEAARLLVKKCNPFNKRDYSIAHMRDLYPLSLHVSMVAHFEEYSIPFPNYLDKGSYWRVAEDGMYIVITTSMRQPSWYGSNFLSTCFVLLFSLNPFFLTGRHRRSKHGSPT